MRYGFVLPKGDARTAADTARAAEEAGWDAFFVWEPVWGIDPWVALAAAAMQTSTIRLGTMLTPLPIRKPWKLASETATLDNLSGGRLILSVGLGAPETGFASFGEPVERKERAARLDEGLAILTGLWRGQPFAFDGQYYHVQETSFSPPPPPLQQPRIPIWVVGAWPRERSMRRVLQYDGLLPNFLNEKGEHQPVTHEALRAMRDYVTTHRPGGLEGFEIVMEGRTGGQSPAAAREQVAEWQEAGATWWIEAAWDEPDDANVLRRVMQGPPR